MKQPRLSDLKIDPKGTREMRARVQNARKVKITINIDEGSLKVLREIANTSGGSYQKLLNQILKDGLKKHISAETRLDRLEKEFEKLKKKFAA